MVERLGEAKMKEVISVCDREADIYDYLVYKLAQRQRFVVRAWHDRKLKAEEERLFEAMSKHAKLGTYTINIGQKGGRKARKATITLRSACMKVTAPVVSSHKDNKQSTQQIAINVIYAREENSLKTEEPLRWILFTSEPVRTFEETRRVVKCYEARWHIEEYHKCWKSGAGAERQRMQSVDNLKRMLSLLAVVSVRLLQLRESLAQSDEEAIRERDASEVLTEAEMNVLKAFSKSIRKKTVSEEKYTLRWAYEMVARLGGWCNSKRTGIASWQTIWHGWFRLQERLEGFQTAKELAKI